jgi:gas vesicle protein
MKVPREKLGSSANALVNNLVTQATSKGIPVKVSDVISFKVNMGGTITNPSVKTDLAGSGSSLADDMKDQAKELVEAKKAAVKDSLQAVKNQVKEEVKQEVKNQIAKQLLGQKDSTGTKDSSNRNVKQEAVDKGKSIIKGLFKKN